MISLQKAEFNYSKTLIIASVVYYPPTTFTNKWGREMENDNFDVSVTVWYVYDEHGNDYLNDDNEKVFKQIVTDAILNGNIELHQDTYTYEII